MRVLDGANSGSGYGQMTLMSSLQQIGCLMTSPLGALAFVADLILRPPPESVVVPGLSGMEGIDRVPIPLPAITRPIVRVADSIPVPGPTTVFQKTKEKEYKRMPDQDLSDDMLKTVHYEIKFKLRPYECTFGTASETVSDNMTNIGYAGWKIAQFVQTLPGRQMATLPEGYQKYVEERGALQPRDLKYFEVWFDVVDRQTRDDLRYQERHLELLQKIADKPQ